MSSYLIDTDWVIDVLNGIPSAAQTLAERTDDGLAISLITYAELYEGVYYARDSQSARDGLQTFLREKEILPVTTEIAERFAIMRGQLSRHLRNQIGNFDLLIAATALENNLILLTRNVKDFRHIPALKLFEPSE